jgi:serine/threonine protein kinase
VRSLSSSVHGRLIGGAEHRRVDTWGFDEGDEIVPGRQAMRLLGGGHRYEAWLAWDEHLRTLVVTKLLRPDQADDPAARRALEAEARLLDRLAHPLLVRSFGAGPAGERPHLLLEYVEGPRLSTLIRRYGLIVEQALPLALNLCSVLHYMAAEGVVHLDVKPRNIIMAGSPQLIDLSVARPLDELGSLRGHVGTDAYMAPEQCDAERWSEIGPPADVWGLGVTVHEALTGELPYPRPGSEHEHPQLVHEAVMADGVPPALRDLLRSCLEERPDDRPTAAQLGDALEPFVESLPPPRIGRFRPGGRQLLREMNESSPAAH